MGDSAIKSIHPSGKPGVLCQGLRTTCKHVLPCTCSFRGLSYVAGLPKPPAWSSCTERLQRCAVRTHAPTSSMECCVAHVCPMLSSLARCILQACSAAANALSLVSAAAAADSDLRQILRQTSGRCMKALSGMSSKGEGVCGQERWASRAHSPAEGYSLKQQEEACGAWCCTLHYEDELLWSTPARHNSM